MKQNDNNILLTSNFEYLINANSNLGLSSSSNDCNESLRSILKSLRSNHPQKIIIGHININSIRYKFDILKPMLTEVLDILMISETKLDDSFPEAQFYIEGFRAPFRLDRNKHGGSILLYVRNNINAILLTDHVFPNDIEAFFTEIKVNTCKWLVCCSYNPNRINVSTHLEQIKKALDIYSKKYENILLMGDYNVDVKETNMKVFCNQHKFKALNEEPTCFKNFNNPSCIDLFLTNSSKSFEICFTLETGMSDFHKLIITILKVKPDKLPPRIIKYRDYKNFESNAFNNKLQISLKNFDMNNSSFIELKTIFMELLNKVAPQKTKYLRANYSKFMTKELSKAIMLRTKLRNQFLKTRASEAKLKYNKQRNLCVSLLRKTKRNYYENLNLNDISDNEKFWTTVKPLFCNKIKTVENITLDENGKLVRNEQEVANIFNDFFVNIVPNLGINTEHDFLNTTYISHNPIENAISKYENHSSVITIKKHMKGTSSSFPFHTVTKENIAKLITNLDIKKAVQSMDIPTKLVKEFGCLFSSFIASNVTKCIKESTYVDAFKKSEIRALYKKRRKNRKIKL